MWWSTLSGRLEQAKQLDRTVDRVDAVAHRVLPRGPVKDALHGTWLGHQLHPLLIAAPIGLWTGATLLDVTGGKGTRKASQRLVGAGLLAAVPTAASGLADWSELGAYRRPRRVGLVHAAANSAALVLYGASWLARREGRTGRGTALALLGGTALATGGYLGGHLAYAQGVGVNRNADEPKKPRDWQDAAAEADLGDGAVLRVEVAGNPVLLTRRAGQLYAVGARCSHYGGPLDQGEVLDGDEPSVVCPWHGSTFRLRDGGVVHGPATCPQTSYETRVSDGRVQVKVRA